VPYLLTSLSFAALKPPNNSPHYRISNLITLRTSPANQSTEKSRISEKCNAEDKEPVFLHTWVAPADDAKVAFVSPSTIHLAKKRNLGRKARLEIDDKEIMR
jgi:hypothetical protein